MGREMMSPNMGMFTVRVTVFSADEGTSEEIELIVDTGSMLTWIPRELAHRLGLRARTVRQFRSIERGGIARPVGDAVIDCERERGAVGIVFGEPGDAGVLGVTALERLGFDVDPVAQILRRKDALPAFALG